MQVRKWIDSGISEELDQKQVQLLKLVHEKVRFYYDHLYKTAPRYRHPLSLSKLAKLCKRSGSAVTLALRYLANTIIIGDEDQPLLTYKRFPTKNNNAKRYYQIFLKPPPEPVTD